MALDALVPDHLWGEATPLCPRQAGYGKECAGASGKIGIAVLFRVAVCLRY